MKGFLLMVAVFIYGGLTILGGGWTEAASGEIKVSKEAQACIGCHEAQSPSFVKEWKTSKHAAKGVDCYTCHRAEKTDTDAMEHNGFTIAVLVTPKDCGQCHPREVKEMTESHHAKAQDVLNSLDNYLGEVVGGPEAVTVGCQQCHGGERQGPR